MLGRRLELVDLGLGLGQDGLVGGLAGALPVTSASVGLRRLSGRLRQLVGIVGFHGGSTTWTGGRRHIRSNRWDWDLGGWRARRREAALITVGKLSNHAQYLLHADLPLLFLSSYRSSWCTSVANRGLLYFAVLVEDFL